MIEKNYERLSLFLFVGSFLSLMSVGSVMAEPELKRTLTVTGNGTESIATTVAEVSLGVEIQGKNAEEVQQKIASRTSAVVDVLRSKKVKQLETTGVRLYPNYEQIQQNNSQMVLTGYTGTNTVSFRISTEQVGTLLDETVKAGASRVDGVNFTAAPEAIFMAKKDALRKASINAQEQADVVLDTLNLASKEIVKIEVDSAQVSQPQALARDQLYLSESKVSTPVIAGEQTVEASVTLQITY
ncbi:MAG: hypothetical protein RLZZ69_3102 [Cyanobacteriota bacterium]